MCQPHSKPKSRNEFNDNPQGCKHSAGFVPGTSASKPMLVLLAHAASPGREQSQWEGEACSVTDAVSEVDSESNWMNGGNCRESGLYTKQPGFNYRIF